MPDVADGSQARAPGGMAEAAAWISLGPSDEKTLTHDGRDEFLQGLGETVYIRRLAECVAESGGLTG